MCLYNVSECVCAYICSCVEVGGYGTLQVLTPIHNQVAGVMEVNVGGSMVDLADSGSHQPSIYGHCKEPGYDNNLAGEFPYKQCKLRHNPNLNGEFP